MKFDTFVQDWVHLKPRGLGALCLAYKKAVTPGSSFAERNQHGSPRPKRTYEDSRKFSKHRGQDNRGDDLSILMRNFEIGLRGFIKR